MNFRLIKKYISNNLLFLGIFMLIISFFHLNKWIFIQNKFTGEEEKVNNILETEMRSSEDTNSINIQEKTMIDTDTDHKTSYIKRENYEDGMMIIHIPKLNIHAGVIKGTSKPQLKKGPGLYEKSPLVTEENANICIAGHRTTYGAWFRNTNKLKKEDEIHIVFNGFTYIYKVEKVFAVNKKEWSITEPTGYSALTLTACHPPGSAKQRLVVRAKLEKIDKVYE
ncbi:class E sortase [Lutibacter sp. B2]|nr:class E sortase [Lutibacter sp. B2]